MNISKENGFSPAVDDEGNNILEHWKPLSLVEWSKLDFRQEDILLGNGWLEIGGISIISAASGLGKA